MPGLTHIGLGFAAKKIAPKVPVIFLIIAAEFIDIIFMIFYLLKIETIPTDSSAGFSPYSHSLVMGFVWTALFIVVTLIFFKKKVDIKSLIVLGALVISHTFFDILASPMTIAFPTDTAKQIFLDPNRTIGFGLWGNKTIMNIGEYGIFSFGVLLYLFTVISNKIKKNRSKNVTQQP